MFEDLIEKIERSKQNYSRELILVCKVQENLQTKMGDSEIYISESPILVAKVLDYIPSLPGHPEVTKEFFISLPSLLNEPNEILKENENSNKIFIICGKPTHRVVLEIKRQNNKTEINTIHRIRESTLEKLKNKSIIL